MIRREMLGDGRSESATSNVGEQTIDVYYSTIIK